MEQRHRKPAHARAMFAVIEKYLTSGLSQIAFCKQAGLPYSRFNYWLKQYRLREALSQQVPTPVHTTTNETPADFIPLRITPAKISTPSPTCAIEFPSGIVVRFQGPVDPAVLAQLIRAEQAEP